MTRYTPPSIVRLGSLTDLTLGGEPVYNPGENNGCKEVPGIGLNKPGSSGDGFGHAETGCS